MNSAAAVWTYVAIFPAGAPETLAAFAAQIVGTPAGWTPIVAGTGIGFIFAVIVLTSGVVSFPMVVHRDVGVLTALRVSARAVLANPGIMAVWGLVVAAILIIGSLPGLIGLIIALPVLGHATWHLYRKLVIA